MEPRPALLLSLLSLLACFLTPSALWAQPEIRIDIRGVNRVTDPGDPGDPGAVGDRIRVRVAGPSLEGLRGVIRFRSAAGDETALFIDQSLVSADGRTVEMIDSAFCPSRPVLTVEEDAFDQGVERVFLQLACDATTSTVFFTASLHGVPLDDLQIHRVTARVDPAGAERRPLSPPSSACLEGLPVQGIRAGDLGPAPGGAFTELTCVEVRNDQPLERRGEVAYSGIPLPRETGVTDIAELLLVAPGERRVAAQFDVLSRWGGPVDDVAFPIRWLQVSVAPPLAPAGNPGARAVYSLRRMPNLPAVEDPYAARIQSMGGGFAVDTGLATFTLDPQNPALLTAISMDLDDDGVGRVPIYGHTPGAGPRLELASGAVLDTTHGNRVRGDPGGFRIVEEGPVKVVVALDGHFSGAGGTTLCHEGGTPYERFGYTAVFTFYRARRDVALDFHFRNECSDALSGPWTDQAVTLRQVSWEFPLSAEGIFGAGAGAVTPGTSSAVVEQRKGGGNPWRRRVRLGLDGVETEAGEGWLHPVVAAETGTVLAAAQMAWMRFREPQALAASAGGLSLRFVSEPLVVGEGKGLWNRALVHLLPASQHPQSVLEAIRLRGSAALERGLLLRLPLASLNAGGVLPSLGTDAASPLKSAYRRMLEQLHGETVQPGGQWDRAKTFGSQLWPDTQRDLWLIDNPSPSANSGAMNYWNPSGAELLEFLRSGEPRWAWDFALPQSWLQAHTAYLNTARQRHGNRAGFAVTSGGDGEGQWHRSAFGSDDYSYNLGLHLAYAIRPDVALRDRFAQAGVTAVERYSLGRSEHAFRERFVSEVDITRQVIQHFEMLANCAEFVPGADGRACHGRLLGVVQELVEDNLRAGILCQGDPASPPTTRCGQPQQFMQSALFFHFFHRILRNYGDPGGLRKALTIAPRVYADQGMARRGDGGIAVAGDWAALLECALTQGGQGVGACDRLHNGDGVALLNPNKLQTVGLLLMAAALDPALGLCDLAAPALEGADLEVLTGAWEEFLGNDAGWWKGSAQMMQGVVFAVGGYDHCRQ